MKYHHWKGTVCRECEADWSWCDNPPRRWRIRWWYVRKLRALGMKGKP